MILHEKSLNDKNLFKMSLNGLTPKLDATSAQELNQFFGEFYLDKDNELTSQMMNDNRFEVSHDQFIK